MAGFYGNNALAAQQMYGQPINSMQFGSWNNSYTAMPKSQQNSGVIWVNGIEGAKMAAISLIETIKIVLQRKKCKINSTSLLLKGRIMKLIH